ncbi:MAG TPA: hypothetical protein VGP26_24525 [Actinophytocola sp.]|jgi:hypothetical protein|nr:hypothetical protein [Actinophytocola sp.]
MAFGSGARLTAGLLNGTFPPSSSDTQVTLGSTTSTSFVETLTGGTACSFTFVAPLSGAVIVNNSGLVDQNTSTTARGYLGWIIREGGSIGSGTTFLAATDDDCVTNIGLDDISAGRARRVTGLTAGGIYNIRQRFRTSAAAGTGAVFVGKHLAVVPVV